MKEKLKTNPLSLTLISLALGLAGCGSKTEPTMETAPTSPPIAAAQLAPSAPSGVAMQAPPPLATAVPPPPEGTPAISLSIDKRNGDPPGTAWREYEAKREASQAAERKVADERQQVENQERSRENARLNQVNQLRNEQAQLEQQKQAIPQNTPLFRGESNAAQRFNEQQDAEIRAKQRQIDTLTIRR